MTTQRGIVQEGFSLIEILIGITIMAIFAAIVGPNFMNYLKNAKIDKTKITLKSFEGAITMFNAHTGQYPARLQDLVKQPSDAAVSKKWQGPYLSGKDVPLDPFGNKYQYQVTPQGAHPYDLFSYGPSGKGGSKEGMISVWEEE